MVSETKPARAPWRAAGPGQSGNPGPALAHLSGLQPDVGGARGRRFQHLARLPLPSQGAVFSSEERRSSPEWRDRPGRQGLCL